MIFAFHDFELDEELYELRKAGKKVPVQPKVLDLLFLLVRERARVVPKKELFDKLWPDAVVSEASLARAALEARRAIGDDEQQVITTVRSRGLRFVGDVTERGAGVASAPKPEVRAPSPSASGAEPYVGRAREDAALAARLDAAIGGHGSLVWISGEAGIGKTRTAEELGRAARGRSATVLVGRCHESESLPAHWPWTQVARALVASRPEPEREPLARALAPLFPDLAPDAPAAPPASGEARFRLYDGFVRRLVAAARQAPIVIVLEDLHWADVPSLELLRFLAREALDAPLLVVATYRDNEVGEGDRARALGALLREHGSDTIPLSALSPDDVAALTLATTGQRADVRLADKLREKSGGNPLYLRQLLKTEWATRALARAGNELKSSMDLQHGLLQSIARHLDALRPECQATLALAAVIGPEFDVPLLAAVAKASHEKILDQLEEAARARILFRQSMAKYRFAHALVRDVLYKKLTAAQRVAHHREVAEAILALSGGVVDTRIAELAMHMVRAAPGGDAARAVELSTRAGDLAKERGESREAAAHYERALEALRFVPGGDEARAAELRARLEKTRAAAGK